MKDPIIRSIFSTALYITGIGRQFSKQENNYFCQDPNNLLINYGNRNTKNRYVLNTKTLKSLKQTLETYLNNYFTDVLKIKNTATPYITQSWLNYTNKGEFHHEHAHPNSYLSGVLYINTTKDDCITFHKREYEQIQLGIKEYNTFNSPTWRVPVKEGMIIIFPSNLKHSVDKVKEDKTRISLSFNSFVKGSLGDKENLTEVKL